MIVQLKNVTQYNTNIEHFSYSWPNQSSSITLIYQYAKVTLTRWATIIANKAHLIVQNSAQKWPNEVHEEKTTKI